MSKLKGVSLFANVGIAETYLKDIGIDIVVANELIEQRAKFYKHLYPVTDMIVGDITKEETFDCVIKKCREQKVDFLIATPPCQGMSLAGKMDNADPRNSLIYYAVKAIKVLKPKYVLIENVPQQLKTTVFYNGKMTPIPQYLKEELCNEYNFAKRSLICAKDFDVPQMRKRNITLLSRKDMKYIWELPSKAHKEITLKEAIGNLPSVDPILREGIEETLKIFPDFYKKKEEAIQVSKWHYPPTHAKRHVINLMRTPSGCSAIENKMYYPKKENGDRVNGHYNTYRRFAWDKPARTITQNSGVISSLCCVHPGRAIRDTDDEETRLYSDARCLTIYELLIVTSLPTDWNIPEWADERLIRSVIGEGVPPMLIKNIALELINNI